MEFSQAYLQSQETLKRDIFITYHYDVKRGGDELYKYDNPYYGLPESGYYWEITSKLHQEKHFGIISTTSDRAV